MAKRGITNLLSDPHLKKQFFTSPLKPRIRNRPPRPRPCTWQIMPRSPKQTPTPRMRLGVRGDSLITDAVVERHVVVVVTEMNLPVAGDAQRDGVVRVLRLLDVVRELEDFPVRRVAAAVEVAAAEGDILAIVCARRFVIGDVLPTRGKEERSQSLEVGEEGVKELFVLFLSGSHHPLKVVSASC